MKRFFILKMKFLLLQSLFWAFPCLLCAQVCGFSEGKNLVGLRTAVYAKNGLQQNQGKSIYLLPDRFQQPSTDPQTPRPLVFLPNWSADQLPFFCKIEHNWGKKARIPLKFRLGSVEYVDWLEGK
jgi:hypothetical protein